MKRRWAVALLFAGLVVPALAQVRGVPASITSQSPMRSFTPGVPASITSLGPNGFGGPCTTPGALVPSALGCIDPQFSDPRFGVRHFGKSFNLHRRHGGFAPIYVPYPYPVVVEQPVVVQDNGDEEDEDQPPAPTIFERRPRTAPPAVRPEPRDDPRTDSREPAPAAPAVETRPDAPPVLLIFRDGHEREVKNYAIVGNTLYDLGTFVALKIPLVNLNLKATVKANEDRGIDFTLPSSIKLE
jgi:hypothetical protein